MKEQTELQQPPQTHAMKTPLPIALSFKALNESPPESKGFSGSYPVMDMPMPRSQSCQSRMLGLYNNELMLKSDVKGKSK